HGLKLFAIEIESKFDFAIAGRAEGQAELEIVGSGGGYRKGAGPAHGEALVGRVRREAGDGVGGGPIEIDLLVGAGDFRLAVEGGVSEVFGFESFDPGAGGGAEKSAGDGNFSIHDVG